MFCSSPPNIMAVWKLNAMISIELNKSSLDRCESRFSCVTPQFVRRMIDGFHSFRSGIKKALFTVSWTLWRWPPPIAVVVVTMIVYNRTLNKTQLRACEYVYRIFNKRIRANKLCKANERRKKTTYNRGGMEKRITRLKHCYAIRHVKRALKCVKLFIFHSNSCIVLQFQFHLLSNVARSIELFFRLSKNELDSKSRPFGRVKLEQQQIIFVE